MVGIDFTYNGKSLSDFGLIMSGSGADDNWGMSRSILQGQTTPYKVTPLHYDTMYSETTVLNFCFIPNLCNGGGINIDYMTLRMVDAWLTSPRDPLPLYIEFEGEVHHIYDGIWTNIYPSEFNGLTGIQATFTTNSPYPYNYRHVKFSSDEDFHTFYCDTDELHRTINPDIIIIPRSAGEFTIEDVDNSSIFKFNLESTNKARILTDKRIMQIENDGRGFITPQFTNNSQGLSNLASEFVKIQWPVVYPGINRWRLAGNGSIEVHYKVPIKVGGYTNV